MTLAPEEIKACCAAAYGSVAARLLLGESFHPGGADLTARLAGSLGLGPGALALDVACGLGSSAIQLARDCGCDVIGVDLSPENVAEARRVAVEAGLDRVRFVEGDAEALPLPDGSIDGVLCECALCTFPDKQAAARELARVLRPGARLALADVTAERDRLPAELRTLTAWVACIADARPLEEIAALLDGAGLLVEGLECHDDALVALLERVEARLDVLRLSGVASTSDGERAKGLLRQAREAVQAGTLGYGSIVARRA